MVNKKQHVPDTPKGVENNQHWTGGPSGRIEKEGRISPCDTGFYKRERTGGVFGNATTVMERPEGRQQSQTEKREEKKSPGYNGPWGGPS